MLGCILFCDNIVELFRGNGIILEIILIKDDEVCMVVELSVCWFLYCDGSEVNIST